MARKNFLLEESRRLNSENMFVSADKSALRRGRRAAPRTKVCRPCLVWFDSTPEEKKEGVLLDLNPHGMKLRMLESIEEGKEVVLQMMRDDEFTIPLSQPIRGRIVRRETGFSGFIDHGVKTVVAQIKRPEEGRYTPRQPQFTPRRRPPRMHTLDFRVGDDDVTGRRR